MKVKSHMFLQSGKRILPYSVLPFLLLLLHSRDQTGLQTLLHIPTYPIIRQGKPCWGLTSIPLLPTFHLLYLSVQFNLVTQTCLTPCNPMDCSTLFISIIFLKRSLIQETRSSEISSLFIVFIFAWNVPFVSLIFLKRLSLPLFPFKYIYFY